MGNIRKMTDKEIEMFKIIGELRQELADMTAEAERYRNLAVDWSLKSDVFEMRLNQCENMKLAHEFEELLQTTSIPVAVEKVRGLFSELEQAQSDNAALVEALSKGYFGREVEKILANPHPGADMLKELGELRNRNADYKDIVGLSCEEYRLHRERIAMLEKELEQYKRALELACMRLCEFGPKFSTIQWSEYFLSQAKTGDKL